MMFTVYIRGYVRSTVNVAALEDAKRERLKLLGETIFHGVRASIWNADLLLAAYERADARDLSYLEH